MTTQLTFSDIELTEAPNTAVGFWYVVPIILAPKQSIDGFTEIYAAKFCERYGCPPRFIETERGQLWLGPVEKP